MHSWLTVPPHALLGSSSGKGDKRLPHRQPFPLPHLGPSDWSKDHQTLPHQAAPPAPFSEERHVWAAGKSLRGRGHPCPPPAGHRCTHPWHGAHTGCGSRAPRDPRWAAAVPSFQPLAHSIPWKPLGPAPEPVDTLLGCPHLPRNTHTTPVVHFQFGVSPTTSLQTLVPASLGTLECCGLQSGRGAAGTLLSLLPPTLSLAVYLASSQPWVEGGEGVNGTAKTWVGLASWAKRQERLLGCALPSER